MAMTLRWMHPDAQVYWSEKLSPTPGEPPRSTATLGRAHTLCWETIQGFRGRNATAGTTSLNIRVWQVMMVFMLGASLTYTVIVTNLPNKTVPDSNQAQIPEAKTSKPLVAGSASQMMDEGKVAWPHATAWYPRPNKAVYQWEQVRPNHMGWLSRLNEGAQLPRRFRQLGMVP